MFEGVNTSHIRGLGVEPVCCPDCCDCYFGCHSVQYHCMMLCLIWYQEHDLRISPQRVEIDRMSAVLKLANACSLHNVQP